MVILSSNPSPQDSSMTKEESAIEIPSMRRRKERRSTTSNSNNQLSNSKSAHHHPVRSSNNKAPRKSVSFGLIQEAAMAAASADASNIRRSVSSETGADDTGVPSMSLRGSKIAELKARLRSSVHEGTLKVQATKAWQGKDWDEASETEVGDDDTTEHPDDELLLNSEAFKKSFKRNSSFWNNESTTKELKDKNESLEKAGTNKHGVTKRRLANLKGLLQQGVLDQVDANNIQIAKSKSEDSNEDGSAASAGGGGGLLNLLVKASKDTVKQKQLQTGRLYSTTNKLQQLRYQRAAFKLQKFFKQSVYVTRKYRLDRRHLKADLKDIRKQQRQQLADIQERLEMEKQQFQLQLRQEYAEHDKMVQHDWEQYQQQANSIKQEIEEWKQTNTTLQQDITAETRRQEQLELESQNPERLALVAQIERLQQDEQDWKKLQAHYESSITKTNEQIEAVTNHFFFQKQCRKKVTKSIKKIITAVEEKKGEAASVVDKLQTLKTKKDARYTRLKEARSNGEYPIPTPEELATTLAEQYAKEKLYFDEIRKLESERKEKQVALLKEKEAAAEKEKAAAAESNPPTEISTNESQPQPQPQQEKTKEEPQPPKQQERKEQFEDLYELGDLLGEGEFGAVYKCIHKASQNERAVKILDKLYMDQWEYDSVIKEFEMLSAVDNPNCIQVYEFYDVQDKFYIVQELAKGGELYDELIAKGQLPEQDVATLMRSILSCVQHLESNNICHRDLNLENVLLGGGDDGGYENCKVIDFGLAAECPDGERLYEMVGKARYIAPEVLGDSGYGLKNDIWSCGVTAYTLLAGFCPFEAEYDVDVYPLIVEGYVDLKDPVWEGISAQAKDFVSKMLTYKEEDRPTAAEALQHPWFTNNDSGITFSSKATPAPQVVWTASSAPTVTATAAVAEVKLATEEEPMQSAANTNTDSNSKKKKKQRKSKKVKLDDVDVSESFHSVPDFSESLHSGPDISESFHTDEDAALYETNPLYQNKVEIEIQADPPIHEMAELDMNETSYSGGLMRSSSSSNSLSSSKKSSSNSLSGSKKSSSNHSLRSSSSKKSKKKQKKIAKKEKEEDEQVAALLRKRANKINTDGNDNFSKMIFSGANHGTKKTALATNAKSKLKGSALLKGAVKDVMGRQRRVSALQTLMRAGSKSDDDSDSDAEEVQKKSPSSPPKEEKKTKKPSTSPKVTKKAKGAGASKLKGAVKEVMGRQRRASALMSLISDLGDSDEENEEGEDSADEGEEKKEESVTKTSAAPTTTRRKKRKESKKQERRASALMSLITNLGDDDDEGGTTPKRVGAENAAA